MGSPAPAPKTLIHGDQYWVRCLDPDISSGNMAQISLLSGDSSQPVNITASVLMAVASPELQFLLHQSGCFCQAPVIVSIPSTTRSILELVRQVLCHGQADQLSGQYARRSCRGVRDILKLIAPGVNIENMIMSCKEEEEDSALRSVRWVRKGIKIDLSQSCESDSGMNLDISRAGMMLSNQMVDEEFLNEVVEEAVNEVVEEAVNEVVEEAVNVEKDHDYIRTMRVDSKHGKRTHEAKKVKSHLKKDVWKDIVKSHQKKVQKLNQSVIDFGFIRPKYSPREVRELVPRRIKKESGDPDDKIECGLCGKTFTTAPSVVSHMVKHSPSRDDVFCPVCAFSAEFSKLVNHVRSRHLHEKVYKCDVCQTEFSTHSAKSSHMLKHSRSDTLGQFKNINCKKFYKKNLGKGCTSCSKSDKG